MSVVPVTDNELEALEEEERLLDLQIAKQEKLNQIAEKKQQLAAAAAGGSVTGAPTITHTATLTVKKGLYQEHSESHTSHKSSGISASISSDLQIGYKEDTTKGAQIQWKKDEQIEGSMPINLNQPSGSVDNTQVFLAAMGVSADQILALKSK